MLAYTACRIVFYVENKSLFNELSSEAFITILWGGLKFDIVAVIYINALFIISQIIPWPFKYNSVFKTTVKWIFIISNAVGLLFNVGDAAYYKFTLKRTTATVFEQFGEEQNKLGLSIQFILEYWYLSLFFTALMIIIYRSYKYVQVDVPARFKIKHYAGQAVMMILILALCVVGVRGGWRHSTRPITLSNAGEFVSNPAEMSIVLNTPFSLLKTIGSKTLQPVNYFNEEELIKKYNPIYFPKNLEFQKKNIIFIIVESLGKEHIGALNKSILNGRYKGYTPFLDSLIQHSYYFEHSLANGRKSIDALPSIISGIPSIKEPFVLSPYSGNKTTSIAKLLANEGYETSFFHGAPNGSMGFNSYINLAGIKKYYGKTEYNNDEDFDGIWGIWDEPFLQYMAKELNTFKEPFFSAVFTVSSHHPFKVPKQYEGVFPKGPLEVQEPVGYTDMALKKFFDAVRTAPWFSNTLFVITADHATVSHLPEYKNVVGHFSVPIIFYTPDGSLIGNSNKLIQQIDLLPTVLNHLNYPKPYFSFGFDAFSHKDDNFVVNNNDGIYNLYSGDYLLMNDGLQTTALYNFKTDRLLEKNLKGSSDIQKKLEDKLMAFIQQYNNRILQDQLTLEPK